MKIQVPETVKTLCQKSTFPIYITGGYIRNAILNLGESDVDLCGPVAAAALGLPKNYYIKTVNFRLGTAIIRVGNEEFEYTPFRTEEYDKGGAHTPTNVAFTGDIKSDVLRRDFTCNSLYYDVKKDVMIDLVGGVADAENRILRAKNPEKVFMSDGLRLMRLVRIAAETGFKIEAATAACALKNAVLLKDISAERKRDELNKILIADTKYGIEFAHYRGLKLLYRLDLIRYIIPQLMAADKMLQNPLYHKYDVLEHIFQTVKIAPKEVRLAALFHDIGKPYCFNNFGKMHGHEKASARIAVDALGNFGLKYPNYVIEEVERLCLYHMYDMDGKTSENKVKMFIAQNIDIIDKLVMLIKADKAGSGLRDVPTVHRFEVVKQKMLDENTPITIQQLKIDGKALIELGITGANIGALLKQLHSFCIVDPHLNNTEWLLDYAKRHKDDKIPQSLSQSESTI